MSMKNFVAIEMDVERGEPTGRREHYQAATINEAVSKVLYTHSLKNGNCVVGKSGRTVICGSAVYVVKPEKRRR